MKHRDIVIESLRQIREHWGGLVFEEPQIAAWGRALSRFTDDQVRIGTELLLRYHTYGAPAPAHLCGMIQGKPQRVLCDSVYAATYKSVTRFAWEERGDDPPGGLSSSEARAALIDGGRAVQPEALPDRSVGALADGLAEGMRPARGGR
jgi:hypothetical protein